MLFKKLKQLFVKSKESKSETEDEIIGSVTYYVKKTSDDIFLDLHLGDYEEENLIKFSRILSGISSIRIQIETIEMLKHCFAEEDKDIFEKIIYYILQQTNSDVEALERANREALKEDQPWIKPSDMIK